MTTQSGTSTQVGTPAKAKPSRRTTAPARIATAAGTEAATISLPHDADTQGSGTQDHHAPPSVPASPEGVVIEIPAIATRLSRLARWCGGGARPCSVAEHSVLVTKIMERAFTDEGADIEAPFICRALLFGLLHDAHEAFTGDMTRQVQNQYEAELPGFAAARARLNARWDSVIFEAAGLGAPEPIIAAAIGHADEMAGEIERGVLFDGEAGGATDDRVVPCWPPEQARHAFMALYAHWQAGLRG